ncbi:peptidase inhibitor I78 family protein [Luteimonas cucumeris]|uniref:Peptidase inhibitor I78 family protein n=1 Tax=Luteimonas cucumeris TaxID=985012 RepID=A0A562KWL1_9GAMM|nr:I78 family peptidase inhibitor [Luteimonas cucumeris]TWH99736.1 peptidase inhibitor I78 family protein [Luteimonas cucumeris]
MYRIASILFALSLAACNGTTPPSTDSTAATGDTAAVSTPADAPAVAPENTLEPAPVDDAKKVCDASKVQSLVGQTASQDVVDKAKADSGSGTTRVIKPGEMVTMDFQDDRLTLEVDDGNVIQSVRCG